MCLSLSRLTSYDLQASRLAGILEDLSSGKNLVQALDYYVTTLRLKRNLLAHPLHKHLALHTTSHFVKPGDSNLTSSNSL